MRKFVLLGMIVLGCLAESFGQARKDGGAVYRCYQHVERDLLDSLKRAGTPFKGIAALRRETAAVEENARVGVTLRRPGRRRMDGTEIAAERRESVLLVAKYLRATTRPEQVITWASAVVLSEDGVCVTNYHVLRELIDPTARLDMRDSVLFAASESGRVYPIRRVLSYNRAADLAFFEVDTRGDRLRAMPLGGDLEQGSGVWALTNPIGYPWTLTGGMVSRTVREEAGNPFSDRLEITADFAKGSSGGAILDGRGNLAAIVSRISPIYYVDYPPANLQMNVKLVVPVSVIRRLLEER